MKTRWYMGVKEEIEKRLLMLYITKETATKDK